MKITIDLLKEHNACEDQVELFAATFPGGTEFTAEAARKAYAAGLDLNWAVEKFFSEAIRASYLEKRNPLDDDYMAKRNSLVDDYMAKCSLIVIEMLEKREGR